MYQFQLNHNEAIPKVTQIKNSIIMKIEKGDLRQNERLLSINQFNSKFSVARDTVEKAYNILKDEGYVTSVKGKGYYVVGMPDQRLKVLLCFNKLSSYKKIVYEAFVETLGKKANVDLHIHQYDPALLRSNLESNAANYHYIVIMPHFFRSAKASEYLGLLNNIPVSKLMILDKDVPQMKDLEMGVFQDFENDIFNALGSFEDKLDKYSGITVIFPKYSHHPTEIKIGIRRFAKKNSKALSVIDGGEHMRVTAGQLYIVLTEPDLAILIKKIRNSSYRMGIEVGVISFNETIFKELLDISVISTDFYCMGQTAAKMLLGRDRKKVHNPFLVIQRNSV